MSVGLTSDEFDEVFQQFVDSPTSTGVFRWEALQQYAVATDEPSLVAFRDGTPRPERSVRTSPWLARIAASSIAGKDWSRVRRVVEPVSEYIEWELLAYIESQTAGERIAVQLGSDPVPYPDFWLFDGADTDRRAILMHYRPDGVPEHFTLINHDDPLISELQETRDRLAADAVLLNQYLAARHGVSNAA